MSDNVKPLALVGSPSGRAESTVKHFVREEDSLPLLQTPSLTSAILYLQVYLFSFWYT